MHDEMIDRRQIEVRNAAKQIALSYIAEILRAKEEEARDDAHLPKNRTCA
jgi:hypothetical protein